MYTTYMYIKHPNPQPHSSTAHIFTHIYILIHTCPHVCLHQTHACRPHTFIPNTYNTCHIAHTFTCTYTQATHTFTCMHINVSLHTCYHMHSIWAMHTNVHYATCIHNIYIHGAHILTQTHVNMYVRACSLPLFYPSVAVTEQHDQGNLIRDCFCSWLQRVRVHHGSNWRAWQEELEAESSHLNQEHEVERQDEKYV